MWYYVALIGVLIATGVILGLLFTFILETIRNNLSPKKQVIIRNFAIGVGIVVILWCIAVAYAQGSWSGKGQVNVSRATDTTNSSRLSADMEVRAESDLFFLWPVHHYRILYIDTIETAQMDEGIGPSFNNCVVNDDTQAKCTSNNGEDYYIELFAVPERTDNSN